MNAWLIIALALYGLGKTVMQLEWARASSSTATTSVPAWAICRKPRRSVTHRRCLT